MPAVEFKDYYATLGVSKSASDAEIKKAYRKLARQHHPDLNPGDKTAESKFKDLNEANEVLGDPETRRKYDDLGAHWRHDADAQRQQAAHGPRARTMTPEEMEDLFGSSGEGPFSDFFTTFFGGGGGQPRRGSRPARPRRGRDVEQPLNLTLEEAFTGTSRRLSFERQDRPHTVDVRIPAGVREGSRVKVRGEGEPGGKNHPAGDLYLVVRLLPHARVERRGQDLHMKVAVPVTTAVLGGEVMVPTLSGSSLRLRIPELTPSGRVFRLKGHGMPTAREPETRGDLFATVDIHIPAQLTADEREHYRALEKLAGTSS